MPLKGPSNRDPAVIAEARRVVALPKVLLSAATMPWKRPNPAVPQYKWKAVAEPQPVEDVALLVQAFFRPSNVPGKPDKHAFTLVYDDAHRVVCIEGGAGSHTNRVGVGLPWHGKRIGAFQEHMVAPDAVDGYAEPLEPMTGSELWTVFVSRATILAPPMYSAPRDQLQRSLFDHDPSRGPETSNMR